ncbi:MAG: Bifunctional protein: zinc-containing alcohol dehydrogenase, Similar to arginate lyase [Verrucomicrobiales bacterium]|nr:Bifunctional protein: zinc-containing alcohol dehydrogenase, Similar to arginate lyase [Verrucomicrobiales bacterium]
MKAAFIRQTGPPETISYGVLENPKPAAKQCLIKVAAVSVNPIDIYVRSGLVKADLPIPFIVGSDFAGTVVEVGPGVHHIKPGDRVWGTNQGLQGRQGTFAEFAAVDEQWLYKLPSGVSEESAAAAALVGITAHLGLVRDARLKSGETLFVNGGSGGIGSSVVQMAKIIGARVITTAGSPEKIEACLQMGADVAINYKTENVDDAIQDFAPSGVDVWFESLREPNFDQAISHLAMRGRMIVMAGREARPVFPVGPFYVKGCTLQGFAMFNATADEQRFAAHDINRWLAEKKLKPKIDRVLKLSEAAQAHRLQEENTIGRAGTLSGKIVLKP